MPLPKYITMLARAAHSVLLASIALTAADMVLAAPQPSIGEQDELRRLKSLVALSAHALRPVVGH